MSRDLTMIGTIWLALLEAKEPLKSEQLYARLPDKPFPANRRAALLSMAYRLGYVERSGVRGEYVYAATPRCHIPPGIQVVEVMEATA